MEEQESAGAEKATDPLYDWWFDALPSLFGAAGERRQSAGDVASDPTAARILQALKLTQQLLNSLFMSYFGALIGRPAAAPAVAFEDMLRDRLTRLGEQWAGISKAFVAPADIESAMASVAGSASNAIAELLRPLSSNMERAYGGVADAFGLAPMREFESASRELALATLAQRRAQAEYLEVALEAARKGVDALVARLAEMGERGESVDSLLALMRLCARTMDVAMHEAMQSPRALKAAAEAIRTALHAKRQQQRIVALTSEALNVPTRAEVDAAYREIQELKREVRRLRKGAAPRPADVPQTRTRRMKSNGAAAA